MGFNYNNIVTGLQIVPKSSSSSVTLGDFEVLTSTNKGYFHNGSTSSALVTEDHAATLTNKTIDGGSNTLTNIGDGSLSVSYVKADGTRPLTSNWSAGAFSITANSVILGAAANVIAGGTLATSTLILRSTTGVGVSGADIIFQVGNNGSAEALRLHNDATALFSSSVTASEFIADSVTVGSAPNTISGLSTIINTGTLTLPTSTDTLIGRATTDALTNKTISDALSFAEISTPANPASGFHKTYFKSDGVFYALNSSGLETPIGSGGYTVNPAGTVSAGGTVTLGVTKAQYFPVSGTPGPVTASATPFGTSPPLDGTVIVLEGTDDTNTVTITNNDAANGCILNGDIVLYKYTTITLMYRSAAARYIELGRN